MNDYDLYIFETLLEKTELRNSEIRDQVLSRLKYPKPSNERLNVDISNSLTRLSSEGVLTKKTVGHKDVRYSFKNNREREKAQMKISFQDSRLNEVIRELVFKEDQPISTLQIDMLLHIGDRIHRSYVALIANTIKTKRFEDLLYLRVHFPIVINGYYDTVMRLFEDKRIQRRIEGSASSAHPDDVIPLSDLKDIRGLLAKTNAELERELKRRTGS